MKTTFSQILSFSCFAALPFLPIAAFCQTTPVSAARAQLLQNQLDYILDWKNVKGLSASVIIPGEGVWHGVSGVSHDTVAITPDMGFGIGSITKNFTAAAILLLQEDGLLSITDSLHEHLPTYPNVNPNITIKQLLQHRSGIYNYTNSQQFLTAVNNNPSQAMAPEFVLNNYVYAPTSAPGTTFQYSNTNYLLLGEIIEEVTGQDYPAVIRQRLLNPLQLNSFYMGVQEPAIGIMPHPWWDSDMNGSGTDMHTFPMEAIWGTSAADGALIGTAGDLAKWGQLIFTGQVLSAASLQQMTTFMPASGSFNGYGLGLMRYNHNGSPAWGHGGNIAGFAAGMAFSPADSIVVSLVCNQDVSAAPLVLSMLTKAKQSLVSAPEQTLLENEFSCFPNPAGAKANIRYVLTEPQEIELTLLNSLGQEVKVLQNKQQMAGEHYLEVETSGLSAGLYFCRMKTKNQCQIHRWVINP